jgi:hypothetical protein
LIERTYELSPLSRVGRLVASAPGSRLGVVVPRVTYSTVLGLVAEVLGRSPPVAEEGSLSDRVVLSGNSGDLTGQDNEADGSDESNGSSREVHCC